MKKSNTMYSNSFVIYAILNFIEKFFAYTAPLILLKLIGNQDVYNKIEFIYSIALMLNIFFDFGIRGYFIYSFRLNKSIKDYSEKVFRFLNLLLLLYLILFIFFFFIEFNIKISIINTLIIILIFIRSIYLLIINFYRVYFRIKNVPSNIYYYTIPVNILVFVLVVYFYFNNIDVNLEYFFIPFFFLVLFHYIKIFINSDFSKNINLFINFIKKSLKYYWPLIIISFVNIFIGNYMKIFSFLNMDEDDMTKISFYLRYLLIIQLAHASFSAFFLSKNFSNNSRFLDKKLLIEYVFLLIVFSFLTILAMPILSNLLGLNYVKLDQVFIILNFYTFTWCLAAYLEQFLNKFSNNKFILKFNLISLLIFITISLLTFYDRLFIMSLGMFISSLIYLLLIINHLKKIGVTIR
jgi:O-antigen/teichoic acid export membrane protein